MAEREIERWITVNGEHIPIFKGQSEQEAINNAIARHNEKKKAEDIKRNKEEADRLNGKTSKKSDSKSGEGGNSGKSEKSQASKSNTSSKSKGKDDKDSTPQSGEIVFTESRFVRANDFYAWWDREMAKARAEWASSSHKNPKGEDDMSRINFLTGGLGKKKDMSSVIAEYEKATGQKLSDDAKRKIGWGVRRKIE